MARKANERVEESREDLQVLDMAKEALHDELKDKLSAISEKWSSVDDGITKKEIKPRRTDVRMNDPILVWYPYWEGADGQRMSAMA